MISQLTGTVVSLGLNTIVIDVNGVGMQVHCAPNTTAALSLGSRATIITSLVVREDSLTLFGFANAEERDMWLLLQTVSGIGPKVALAFVAVLSPDEASRALAEGDIATLTKVPGIGKKGAERLVVELKDKVATAPIAAGPTREAWRPQVREALIGLGWSAREADKAVDTVANTLPNDHDGDVATILRKTLQTMVKGR